MLLLFMPSSPVLLHPHPLFCCIYILPSSPVLLHIHVYCTCVSTFWHCHPYILQHFNGNIFTPLFHWFRCILTCKYNALCVCASPTPFCCSWSCEIHVSNNKEMVFNYTEVIVYRSFTHQRRVLQRFRW